ncbi:hypothetical protein MMC10_009064 [Thelotrema lepadinum]|nr:hypothetical protein [Thelotrema lepadinum]
MFEGKVNKQNSEVYPQKSGNIQEAAEKMAQEQVRQRRNEWYHRERRKASSVYKQILERARQRSRSKGPRHEKRQKYEREWRKRKREKNPEWRQQQLLRDRERYSKKKIERQKNAEAKRKQQMEHNKDQKHKAHPDQLAKRRQRYKARRKSDPQWAADQREKAKARVQKRRKNEEEEGAAVPKASKAGSYGAQSMQPSKGEAPRGDHAKVGENASQSNKYQTPGRKHTPTSPKTSFTLSNSGLEDHDIDLDEVAGQLAFPPLLPRGFKGFETPDCERNGK